MTLSTRAVAPADVNESESEPSVAEMVAGGDGEGVGDEGGDRAARTTNVISVTIDRVAWSEDHTPNGTWACRAWGWAPIDSLAMRAGAVSSLAGEALWGEALVE